MVWYNPLEWPSAAVGAALNAGEGIGRALNGDNNRISRFGLSVLGKYHSVVGNEDKAEFYRMAADPHYTPKVFLEPAAISQTDREKQKQAAQQFADNTKTYNSDLRKSLMPVINTYDGVKGAYDPTHVAFFAKESAGNTQEERAEQRREGNEAVAQIRNTTDTLEITKGTALAIGETAGQLATGAWLTKLPLAAKIFAPIEKLTPFKKFMAYTGLQMFIPDAVTNPGTTYINHQLQKEGEAPMRSIFSYIPFFGNDHYAAGGTIDNYPNTRFAENAPSTSDISTSATQPSVTSSTNVDTRDNSGSTQGSADTANSSHNSSNRSSSPDAGWSIGGFLSGIFSSVSALIAGIFSSITGLFSGEPASTTNATASVLPERQDTFAGSMPDQFTPQQNLPNTPRGYATQRG
jgi:hypothetical protein